MGEFAFYARALWAVCWEQAKHNDRQEMDSPKVAREQALFSAPLESLYDQERVPFHPAAM